MLQHPAAVRAGFEEGSRTLLNTLRSITADQWDRAGALGEWTTRELAAHSLRAFLTIEGYLLGEPKVDRVLADAGEYYSTVLTDPSVHRGVAARGHEAGRQLLDPVGEAEAVIAQTLARVAATADDEPVNAFATRVVEIGVHTLDLQRATGQLMQLHSETSAVVLSVLTQLASPAPLILALTGRRPLPTDFNVLG